MWLVSVVVRRYIDILIIIINFPYSTCIRSFFGSSNLTSLFIFKLFFRSLRNRKGDFNLAQLAPKLRYYGDVVYSFYKKSAVKHDGGV